MPKRNSRIAARLRPRAPSPIAHGESTPTGTHPGTGPRPPLTGRTEVPKVPAMSGAGPIGAILIVLLIVVMLWFALGTQRNVRRGNELLRWLQDGLPLLGKRTTMRWLGSSAIVLKIAEAAAPFREAEVVVVLEPRDVAMLWAWSRRRGRRDFIIFRGWLRRPPRFELEAGDERGWTGGDRLKRLDPESWDRADWEGVRVARSRDADPDV